MCQAGAVWYIVAPHTTDALCAAALRATDSLQCHLVASLDIIDAHWRVLLVKVGFVTKIDSPVHTPFLEVCS